MTDIRFMSQEDLKKELELVKDRFKSIESDWVFQERCRIYQTDENKLLARLNARANQLRCRLKYAFNWLYPDNKAHNWMI